MADFDQYTNYPTFPGMGPWTPSLFERNLTEDYAIDEKVVPASSFATRLDITSGEYSAGAWLGAIIPLPAAVIAGIGRTTVITLTGKYWNWLTRGYFLHTLAESDSDYSIPRPAVFHYQIGSSYKEVAHYGYGAMLLALVSPVGLVFVTNVVSFVPFMEHRHQCSFKRYILRMGQVSSFSISDGTGMLRLTSESGISLRPMLKIEFGNLNVRVSWKSYNVDTGDPLFLTRTFNVTAIFEDSTLEIDASSYKSEIETGRPLNLTGAFYVLDRSIQIEDPKVAYTETRFGQEYIVSSDYGYVTKEQQLDYTSDTWVSIFYDAKLLSDSLLQQATAADAVANSSSDPNTVSRAQADAARYRTESEAVLNGDVVYDGKHMAKRGVFTPVGTTSVAVSDVVLREYEKMGVTSLDVEFDIAPTTLSRHNFGLETQVGNYVVVSNGVTASAYRILLHNRSGVFTLSVESVSSLDTLYSQLTGDGRTYGVLSHKMWKIADICTSNSGASVPSNPSLDRGIFEMTIVPTHKQIVYEDIDSLFGRGVYMVRLKCELSDRNYYSTEYLASRFVDDMEPDDPSLGPIKAWKKFSGWKLNRLGFERTDGFDIFNMEMGPGNTVFVTVNMDLPGGEGVTIEDLLSNLDLSSYVDAKWWVSFDALSPIVSPFNYISTPFIGMNAFLTQIGIEPKLIFNGVYVGSPISSELKSNSALRLIEDFPAIFPNQSGVDFSMIKMSSAKAYRYIAHCVDDSDEAEYILYERSDDRSGALVIRSGRIGFTRDVNETLLHHASDYVDVDANVSGDGGTGTQIVSVDPGAISGMDIISISARFNPDRYPTYESNQYLYTLWRIYQADRLVGIKSTSGVENSILTRAKGLSGVEGVSDIPFYSSAEYFTRGEPSEYRLAGNTMTSDPLAGTGTSFRFVPMLNGHHWYSQIFSATVRAVPSQKVVRNAASRRVFSVDGKNFIFIEQPQWSYMDSPESEIVSVSLVPGTESGNEDSDTPPSPDSVSTLENGVFMLNTSDLFRTYSSGGFFRNTEAEPGELSGATGATMWKYPFLVARNMSQCSFFKSGDTIDIAGYSQVDDGLSGKVTAIVYTQINVHATRTPVFSFNDNAFNTLFLWADIAPSRTIILSSATVFISDNEEGFPPIVVPDLATHPLAVASDGKYKIVVLRVGTSLQFAVSSDIGTRWVFYDDIFLTQRNRVASSPALEIYQDWLYMCYISDKAELRMKKIFIPSMVKLHVKYLLSVVHVSSSSEADEDIEVIKKELQTELDNSFDRKIVDTFDQQVSFSVCTGGTIRVVFFDQKGLVNSAASSDEGESWNISPANF